MRRNVAGRMWLNAVCGVAVTALCASSASAQVRISQIYGAGGTSGATYMNDFVELFNAGTSAASLNGMSIQYASATGSSWNALALNNVSLNPGQYYLIQLAGGVNGVPIPVTPDQSATTINMSGASGKMALASVTTSLTGVCPTTDVVDFIGYGTANCFEGAAAAPGLTATTAAFRGNNGCTDSNNNNADFAALAPAPRNTASPIFMCPSSIPPSGSGVSDPASQCPGFDVTLRVTVTPGQSPGAPITGVVGDASSIGASPMLAFLDDGVPPDSMAGDLVYTAMATVTTTLPGNQSIPVVITDNLNRMGNASITVTILNCNPVAFGSSRGFCNGETGVLTVTVLPGIMPPSTGIMVLVDLTPLGGPGLVNFHDDGLDGDVTAGDNIFSYEITVPANQPAGTATLSGGVLDEQGRSDTFMFSVNTVPCTPASSAVVISQVYGGGGNAGATLTNDYIEIFNRSAASVDITGWTVQYASGSTVAGFLQATPLTGTIPPGGYYLVQEAQGAGGTQPLPTPDAIGTIMMGATAGRVALVNDATLIGTDCMASTIVDLIGYGNLVAVGCWEGMFSAPTLTNTLANFRRDGGCFDNNQNGVDFFSGSPAPRNSASPVNLCNPGPSCPCDWNGVDGVNSQDFFDFLEDFFAGNADYNGMDGTNSQDFFDFLDCFFNPPAGC